MLTPLFQSIEKKTRDVIIINLGFIKSYSLPPSYFFRFLLAQYKLLRSLSEKIMFLWTYLATVFVYLCYLTVYLISHYPRNTSFIIIGVGTVLDILFIKKGELTLLVLLLSWILIIIIYRQRVTTFFILALVSLAFCASTYYLKLNLVSERAGAWAWLFMAIVVLTELLLDNKLNKRA